MAAGETKDIIVAGAGPAGLIAALALGEAGFDVELIGPASSSEDRRTTALMMPSLRFLEGFGLGETVRRAGAPLKTMRIIDATRRLLRSRPVSFHASEIGEEAFGWNIPNGSLVRELEQAVAAQNRVSWTRDVVVHWSHREEHVEAVAKDSPPLAARLVVAADGRNSSAREAAGIRVARHAYDQAALVFNFTHGREHGNVSTEFHTETGPFTQVPLPGARSSLVWVLRPERARHLAEVSDEELSELVEEQMQSMLGRITVEPGRQVYPLSAALPSSFARNRVALIGEAAHVFPPIGAQGLNLGIRDIRDLVETTHNHAEDPGSSEALRAYSLRRSPDILARTGAVNALNRSLLSDLLPAQLARSAGLGLLGAFAPLRAMFMREGMEPGSGFRSAVSRSREEVGG